MDCRPHGLTLWTATPWTVAYQAVLCPWDFPGKSTGVGCHSRRSSQSRDWTRVSCIVGRCFTIWATREVHWQVGINPQQGFCHKLYEVAAEPGFSLASLRVCHSFTQAHCRVSNVQQKACSLEQRTRAPSILTLSWRIPDEPPRWKFAAEPQKMPGFLTSGGEVNLGPVTRLDLSELLCNKVLLKYKREKASDTHIRRDRTTPYYLFFPEHIHIWM